MPEQTRKFTPSDLTLQADGTIEFAAAITEAGKTFADVSLVARTDSVVDSWMGGMVHELKGMFHKDKIPLDWRHDGDEVIGYLDKFAISNTEIRCTGRVVSSSPDDRAATVIKQAEGGIPLESSIFFGGQGLEIEEVPAEKKVTVNGRAFSGPGIVFRKWPMRGVALCPYGRDNSTSVSFQLEEGEELTALVLKEKNMSEEKLGADAIEALTDATEALESATEVLEDKGKGEELPKAPRSAEGIAGSVFIEAFGTDGAVWFTEGRSFQEAMVLYTTKLEERVDELETRLSAAEKDTGGSEALDSDGDEGKEQSAAEKRAEELTPKIGKNLARFAAGIKIRK